MTGDINNMLARLKLTLPARWFADTTPILDAMLTGMASAWAGLYALLVLVKSQTRLATATGVFLDIASADYFGVNLPRRSAESDVMFRARLIGSLLAPRATRAGLALALFNETGRMPVIFEPLNATDTGGYNTGFLGYDACGGYGSENVPFQFFVTAYRSDASPISNASGYNEGPGGYNSAPMFYAEMADIPGVITDADIYAAAVAVLPVATTAWMRISN